MSRKSKIKNSPYGSTSHFKSEIQGLIRYCYILYFFHGDCYNEDFFIKNMNVLDNFVKSGPFPLFSLLVDGRTDSGTHKNQTIIPDNFPLTIC